jgi:hypothetical protein
MIKTVLTGVLALSMMAVPTGQAEACGPYGMMRNVDRDIQRRDRDLLVKAEKALRQGRYHKAFRLAEKTTHVPVLRTTNRRTKKIRRTHQRSPEWARLGARTLRIMSVATVRLNGKSRLKGRLPATNKERVANLTWAADVLRHASKTRPNDTVLKTRLGEAQSKLPGTRKFALLTFKALEKQGRLADAHGYAAYASVLRATGDRAGQKRALKRCRSLTGKRSLCKITPLKVAAAVP